MDFLANQRASQNANRGVYVNGAAYGREKGIEVADVYMLGMDQQVPWRPNNNQPRQGESGGSQWRRGVRGEAVALRGRDQTKIGGS